MISKKGQTSSYWPIPSQMITQMRSDANNAAALEFQNLGANRGCVADGIEMKNRCLPSQDDMTRMVHERFQERQHEWSTAILRR